MQKLSLEIKLCPVLTFEQIKAAVNANNSQSRLTDEEQRSLEHIENCQICAIVGMLYDGFDDVEVQEFVKSGAILMKVVEI